METSKGYERAARKLRRLLAAEQARWEVLAKRLPPDADPRIRRIADIAIGILQLDQETLDPARYGGPDEMWLWLERRLLIAARRKHKAAAKAAAARGDHEAKKRHDRLAFAVDGYLATVNDNIKYLRSWFRHHTISDDYRRPTDA